MKIRKNQNPREVNRKLFTYEVLEDGEVIGYVNQRSADASRGWSAYWLGGRRLGTGYATRQRAASAVAHAVARATAAGERLS